MPPGTRLCTHPAPESVTVSVVIPVKNAGTDLEDLIVRLKQQQGFGGVEVVVVNSGSNDGSAETAQALGAAVTRIAPEDFSHSHARNLGAERAAGDYVLFTVQDAQPPSHHWLREIFAGLQRHEAAAVSCAEEPRLDSDLFYRVISWSHHRFISEDGDDVTMVRSADDDPVNRRRNAQLADTACLMSRDLFLTYRHRGNYAEDLDLGLRLIDDGYRLAYLASPRILHSHNRPAYYHLRRSYIEHLTLFEMLPGYPIAPGDERAAVNDILSSCAALDDLVGRHLPSVSAPCSSRHLMDVVARGLHRARMGTQRGSPAAAPDYLDTRTRAFVKRLQELPVARDARCASTEAPLLDGVAALAGMICEYLEHASQALDQALLVEFRSALYKGWAALHCGVRLASAYWRGPERARETLRDLHDELTRES